MAGSKNLAWVGLLVSLLGVVGCQRLERGGALHKPGAALTPVVVTSTAPIPLVAPQGTPLASPAAGAGVARSRIAPGGRALQGALKPRIGQETLAPKLTRKIGVKLTTSGGEVMIEVYPEAAPRAAERFITLVEKGFYQGVPVSRVVKDPVPFIAQFGINWRKPWNEEAKVEFADEPSYFSFERATIAFAKAGKDHQATQVFINYRDNNRLAEPPLGFTVFAKVVKGMEIVDDFPVVGEPDSGLDQMRLWADGGNYLESLTLKPAMIEKASIVDEPD